MSTPLTNTDVEDRDAARAGGAPQQSDSNRTSDNGSIVAAPAAAVAPNSLTQTMPASSLDSTNAVLNASTAPVTDAGAATGAVLTPAGQVPQASGPTQPSAPSPLSSPITDLARQLHEMASKMSAEQFVAQFAAALKLAASAGIVPTDSAAAAATAPIPQASAPVMSEASPSVASQSSPSFSIGATSASNSTGIACLFLRF